MSVVCTKCTGREIKRKVMRTRTVVSVFILSIGLFSATYYRSTLAQSQLPTKTPLEPTIERPTKTPFEPLTDRPTKTAIPSMLPTKTPFDPSAEPPTKIPIPTASPTKTPIEPRHERPIRTVIPTALIQITPTVTRPVATTKSKDERGTNATGSRPLATATRSAILPPSTPLDSDSSSRAELSPWPMTPNALDFAPLLVLSLGLGCVMVAGFLHTSHAISLNQRQLALLLMRLQRAGERPLTFDAINAQRATDTTVLALLNQAGLDATGQPLHVERVLSVSGHPLPAIISLGYVGQRATWVIFTPLDGRTFRRIVKNRSAMPRVMFEQATADLLDRLRKTVTKAQCFKIDAFNSGLFVVDDLATTYAYVAAELSVASRTLPRVTRWHLFLIPMHCAQIQLRLGWRYRLRRALHLSS